MNRKIIFLILAFAIVSPCATQPLKQKLDHAVQFALAQLKTSVNTFGDTLIYPRSTTPEKKWKGIAKTDWTSGFYPGTLWYAYELSSDTFFAVAARRWTDGLKQNQFFTGNHDIGFMMFNSYGHALRLLPNNDDKAILLQSAETALRRYDPRVGLIKSWDNKKWQYPVIIDNMMNLELLMWGANNGGSSKLQEVAISHADRTMKNHFRSDGSTFHVVSYDSTNGNVVEQTTAQGFSATSVWARGQAWAIYGFTVMYRFTHEKKYLETAQRAADFFLANLPDDKIPYWDFCAPNIPNEPRDASAGAIASSALIELCTFATDQNAAQRYYTAAEEILNSLASSLYLAEGTGLPSVLNHSVTSKPGGVEVDVPLIYADYYFLEAIIRRANVIYTKPE